jgi:hypothetical protein
LRATTTAVDVITWLPQPGTSDRLAVQYFLERIRYRCIVKANGKVRNVLDASKTGFNDCLRRIFVRYSAVEDVVKYMIPGCRISMVDLADVFVLPVDATDCDFFGVQHVRQKRADNSRSTCSAHSSTS